LDVTARRGTLEAVYLSEDRELAAFFKESGVTVQKGQVIAEAARLDALLAAIGRYYQKREKGKECRFDYRLMYLTGDDYRLAREKIERYLYHSGRPLQIRG
jgi:hypothetical protein